MSKLKVRTVAQCLADPSHRLIACDDPYLELLGRERDDVIGCRILDLTYPPDRPANALMLKGLASEGRAFSITKRYVRGDGDLIWVTNGVGSFGDGSGGERLVATCRVEERAIAHDALTRNASAVRRLCAGFLAAKQLFGADLVSAPAG